MDFQLKPDFESFQASKSSSYLSITIKIYRRTSFHWLFSALTLIPESDESIQYSGALQTFYAVHVYHAISLTIIHHFHASQIAKEL